MHLAFRARNVFNSGAERRRAHTQQSFSLVACLFRTIPVGRLFFFSWLLYDSTTNALPPTCFARPKKSHRPTGERKRKNGVILFNGKLTNTTRPDERASLGGKETERLGEIQHSTRLSIAQLPSMHIWARNMASCWGGCYGIASFKLTITTTHHRPSPLSSHCTAPYPGVNEGTQSQ